jgi:hypothetical protein
MRALLDVNVLIALLDSRHLYHRRATDWLAAHLRSGWASCPITQNGCIRILSQPSYPNPSAVALVAKHLGEAVASAEHEFWPDEVSLVAQGTLDWSRVLGPRQVTDAYLLALAVRHGGRLVSLDQGIPLAAVTGAKKSHLEIMG